MNHSAKPQSVYRLIQVVGSDCEYVYIQQSFPVGPTFRVEIEDPDDKRGVVSILVYGEPSAALAKAAECAYFDTLEFYIPREKPLSLNISN